MKDHEPFISAIEAHPDDNTTRLVYADWLDERDHPVGEYLRTELRLAALPTGSGLAPELQSRLRVLRQSIEPEWLARFDQPRVMLANPTPFPAWWGIELPGARAFDATYQSFDYETLPPLRYPQFTGNFDWLPKPVEEIDLNSDATYREERYRNHLDKLVQHLTENGLAVPMDFIRWMTDRSVRRIPSCTGCHIKRSRDVARAEGPPGSRVLPFYVDSQGCVTWYLYLTPEGYHAVLASGEFLCNGWSSTGNLNTPLDNPEPPEGAPDFVFVAPSVETFFYRWWLENTLWHKLDDPQADYFDPAPITPEEQAYIDFYRPGRPSAT